jgi:hypothetical protein
MTSDWVLQLARELPLRLPKILGGLDLMNLWMYKYDNAEPAEQTDGIAIHADRWEPPAGRATIPSNARIRGEPKTHRVDP